MLRTTLRTIQGIFLFLLLIGVVTGKNNGLLNAILVTVMFVGIIEIFIPKKNSKSSKAKEASPQAIRDSWGESKKPNTTIEETYRDKDITEDLIVKYKKSFDWKYYRDKQAFL